MGKLFAALILVIMIGWLGPLCSRLPAGPAPLAAPAVAVAPLAAPPPERPPLDVATYRMKKMFEATRGKYLVYVIRANRADAAAIEIETALLTRRKGTIVERADSSAQTLAAGSTAYFGLGVSTGLIDAILDGPEEPGTELEWSLTYRFEGDASGARRCLQVRALPRRREPEGIFWTALGKSHECAPQTK